MSVTTLIFLIASFVFPFIFVFTKIKFDGPIATMAKTASSFCFILLSLSVYYWFGDNALFGIFIITGLLLGLFGDVFLDLQDPNKKMDSPFLYGGIICFMAEHVTIAIALSLHVSNEWQSVILIFALLGGVLLSVLFTLFEKKILKFEFGKSLIFISLYSALLASSFLYYLILTIVDSSLLVMFAAMALFLISDSVLSVMYFNRKNHSKLLLLINISTYYFAQILFALSIYFL